ncbi:winged helix-turn-helix domain-containing protein [Cryptosporangium arvum]|jgi:DNA-binding winged helix-turn-helix (wHTH) protein|uniref:Response regulator with CheY-like receiver domain and winged-helix DNA-binding domain n=1 Tax=Cryptosporangium arvum DSM 44712 TaxID=927661 RepID=A0A010ZLN3_9ACTN|nr:winged helix-turn-helix domain-containing protein [Cryptosporangium arvum]EXG79574.1 response regulator with CheY-like receiver domain and winged-helix DNA-binding domain [Cryptosporangium arvum DSM 44712]
MTVQPVARPRIAPQRARSRPPASTPAASGATISVEVAVAGPEALETATKLAGQIRDLVDAANAGAGSVAISASVGLEVGAGNRAGRPALTQVGRTGWAPAVPLPAFVAPAPVPVEPAVKVAPVVEKSPVVAAAPLQIFPARRVALLDGVQLQLTRREFDLLVFLSEHAGRVFDRPQLLRLVWGHQVICGERTVDVHIRRLRAKLERTGPAISTVRGVGYRLDAAERVAVVHERS